MGSPGANRDVGIERMYGLKLSFVYILFHTNDASSHRLLPLQIRARPVRQDHIWQ